MERGNLLASKSNESVGDLDLFRHRNNKIPPQMTMPTKERARSTASNVWCLPKPENEYTELSFFFDLKRLTSRAR